MFVVDDDRISEGKKALNHEGPKYALAAWAKQNQLSPEVILERREIALKLAVEGIADGSIDSLDGVDSPLSRRIQKHHSVDLFEMNGNWIETAQYWKCPCCDRGKFEISRVGSKGQILAKLVEHHDHMSDALKAAFRKVFVTSGTDKPTSTGGVFVERIAPAFSSYPPILVCEDCNNADAAAKKVVSKTGRKIAWHSFSIGQIRQFITVREHAPHIIDEDNVFYIWELARPAYVARMNLVYEVAKAAVLQDYWYERYQGGVEPIPTLSNGFNRFNGLELISGEALIREMAKKTIKHSSNYTRWRTEKQPTGNQPPPNFLAIIESLPGCARMWGERADSWKCPICYRSKYEIVSYTKEKVSFQTYQPDQHNLAWRSTGHICKGCFNIIVAMKRELHKDHNIDVGFTFDCITPDELRSIIRARPHSPHLVDAEMAKALMIKWQSRKVD
jgi:rubredoxin